MRSGDKLPDCAGAGPSSGSVRRRSPTTYFGCGGLRDVSESSGGKLRERVGLSAVRTAPSGTAPEGVCVASSGRPTSSCCGLLVGQNFRSKGVERSGVVLVVELG